MCGIPVTESNCFNKKSSLVYNYCHTSPEGNFTVYKFTTAMAYMFSERGKENPSSKLRTCFKECAFLINALISIYLIKLKLTIVIFIVKCSIN